MKTDYSPQYPQDGYTATIKLTGTREDFETLYELMLQSEPRNEYERSIRYDVLNELNIAHSWISEMEDIHRRLTGTAK